MTISDIMVIVAILLAPVTALALQRRLDRSRAQTDRRVEVFRTLMGTRAARLSPAHVHALNMIDVEFHGVKRVTNAWKEYLDHLNTPPGEGDALTTWTQRGDDLFVALLAEIAAVLRYDFDRTHLRRAIYAPQAFWHEEAFQKGIRYGLAQLLTGRYALPVRLVSDASAPDSEMAPPEDPFSQEPGSA